MFIESLPKCSIKKTNALLVFVVDVNSNLMKDFYICLDMNCNFEAEGPLSGSKPALMRCWYLCACILTSSLNNLTRG